MYERFRFGETYIPLVRVRGRGCVVFLFTRRRAISYSYHNCLYIVYLRSKAVHFELVLFLLSLPKRRFIKRDKSGYKLKYKSKGLSWTPGSSLAGRFDMAHKSNQPGIQTSSMMTAQIYTMQFTYHEWPMDTEPLRCTLTPNPLWRPWNRDDSNFCQEEDVQITISENKPELQK